MNTGHPAHQVRDFRVKVRHSQIGGSVITVMAQTEQDALLRTGIALANTYPGTDPSEWVSNGVFDPAPRTWSPEDSEVTFDVDLSPASPGPAWEWPVNDLGGQDPHPRFGADENDLDGGA